MNLLITGAFKYSQDQRSTIEKLGYNIIDMPYEKEMLPVDPRKIEATICNGLFLSHDIRDFENLKLIQLTSAGLDRVPIDYINQKGIKIYNARGVYSAPMAEWVVLRILEYYKESEFFRNNQLQKKWEKLRNLKELGGARIAIVGAGNVGQEIAKRLAAFGAYIVGYDIHENSIENFKAIHLISKFKEECRDFDIMILTAPLTSETKNIIDKNILSELKTGCLIVNVSRGGLINERDLVEALSCRRDLHAALDVFESEPLPANSPLWDLDNAIISPHNSFVGEGNQERLFELVKNNLSEYAKRLD